MTCFKYAPLDLEGRSFRLLQLCTGKGAFVECYLFNALLNDAVSYEALSYTWGGTDKAYTIVVNGGDFAVTKNLFLALQHLRCTGQDRILWIDALCIDQDNDKERGHQVGQMTSIYEQAERVVIWLGLATPETDVVFDYVQRAKTDVEKHRRNDGRLSKEQVRALQDQARRVPTDREKTGLVDLLDRPWFKRAWILQEVAMARSAQVLCGARSVSGYEFSIIPLIIGMTPDTHCQAILDIMPGPTRKHSWWSRNRDLQTLLLKFKDSKASDPRDVIYALLGISSDGSESEVLTPNYEKSMEEVVQDAMKFFLGLSHQASCTPCLPQWSMSEFLQNLESLGGAVLNWALANKYEATAKLLLDSGKTDINSVDTNNQTPLLIAVKNGHNTAVKFLLNQDNVNVNCKDKDSQTPLFLAADNGDDTMVKLLLNKTGINIDLEDQFGWTPLWRSARRGYEAIVERLLDFERSNRRTPTCEATLARKVRISQLLLEANKGSVSSKASCSTDTLLWWAAQNGAEEVVKLSIEINTVSGSTQVIEKKTLLCWACDNDRTPIIKLLLDTGKLDINLKDEKGSQRLLEWAFHGGHMKMIEMLYKKEMVDTKRDSRGRRTLLWKAASDGNQKILSLLLIMSDADIDLEDMNGQTPLWRAARNGHAEVVKLLVGTRKVNLESKDRRGGETPFSVAAKFGREVVVRFLLSTGKVDADSKDPYGGTPLSKAAEYGHEAVVRLLLSTGKVDVNSKDRDGETPLSRAAQSGHEEIVNVLLSTVKVDIDTNNLYVPSSREIRKRPRETVELLEEEDDDDEKKKRKKKREEGLESLIKAAEL